MCAMKTKLSDKEKLSLLLSLFKWGCFRCKDKNQKNLKCHDNHYVNSARKLIKSPNLI